MWCYFFFLVKGNVVLLSWLLLFFFFLRKLVTTIHRPKLHNVLVVLYKLKNVINIEKL